MDKKEVLDNLSPFEHHHSVRKELNDLVKEGEITESEAKEIYSDWLDKRKS